MKNRSISAPALHEHHLGLVQVQEGGGAEGAKRQPIVLEGYYGYYNIPTDGFSPPWVGQRTPEQVAAARRAALIEREFGYLLRCQEITLVGLQRRRVQARRASRSRRVGTTGRRTPTGTRSADPPPGEAPAGWSAGGAR